MISTIIQTLLYMKIQSNMSEQKRNDKKSMICFTPKLSQSFFVYRIQSNEIFFTEKEWRIEHKMKRWFLNALATVIKKGTRNVNKKNSQIHTKTRRTVIKQDLSPDLKLLGYAI